MADKSMDDFEKFVKDRTPNVPDFKGPPLTPGQKPLPLTMSSGKSDPAVGPPVAPQDNYAKGGAVRRSNTVRPKWRRW
jgi:hypothetical protein